MTTAIMAMTIQTLVIKQTTLAAEKSAWKVIGD
jgi:hypothetical protein